MLFNNKIIFENPYNYVIEKRKKFLFDFFSFRYLLELGKRCKIFRNNFSHLFLLFSEKTQKLFFEEKEKKLTEYEIILIEK